MLATGRGIVKRRGHAGEGRVTIVVGEGFATIRGHGLWDRWDFAASREIHVILFRVFLCGALLLTLLCGCGGNRDKGINKDKDRPQSTQNK